MKFLTVLRRCHLCSARAARAPATKNKVRELVAAIETAAEARDASDVLAHRRRRLRRRAGLRPRAAHEFPARLLSRASEDRAARGVSRASNFRPTDSRRRKSPSPAWRSNDPDHERLKVEFRRQGSRLAAEPRRPAAALVGFCTQHREPSSVKWITLCGLIRTDRADIGHESAVIPKAEQICPIVANRR